MSTRPSRSLVLAGALTLSLTLAACGDDAGTGDDATTDEAAAGGSGEFPVTIDTPDGEVSIPAQPQRIVSLSPSSTEILFTIGAGDQVVAVDEWSTYPPEAPITDLSGYEPNVEAIIGYEPDLVVIASDPGGLVDSLETLDIPVLSTPAPVTVDQGWDGMAVLGLATGHVDETAEVVADLRQQVDDAFALAEEVEGEGIRVYHELDESLFAASSPSFIGDVYARMGAVNVADEADTEGTGYLQLTEEALVAANPQLIVITDVVAYSAEDVANRPGWQEIDAVRNGDIVTVDADISSRWGPRLPQLITTLAEAMTEAAAVPADR